MSHLANVGLAKADSPTEIQMSKRVGRPVDDPSSVEMIGAFLRSPVDSHSPKLELDYARDRIGIVGGT